MDVTYDTLPPVVAPEDTAEERNRRLIASAGGMSTLPPVTPQQRPSPPPTAQTTPAVTSAAQPRSDASGSALVKSYAPGSPDYNSAVKQTEPSAMSPVQPVAPKPTPLAQPSLPPVGKTEMAGAPAAQPGAMPPVSVGPQQKAYDELSAQGAPKLSGWKKALDAVGSIFPIGRSIETAIPGSPQNYDAKLNNAALRAAKEQTIGAGQRTAESEAAKAQFETPEKRRAYMAAHPDEFEGVSDFQKNDFVLAGKFPQREPAEEKPHDVVKAYSDALASGDEAKAAELAPKVQKFMETTQKPPKETPDKLDKKIDEFVDPKNNRVNVMQRPDGTTYNAIRGQSRSEAGVGSPSDVKDIADGIKGGIDPPDLSKYGYRDRTAIAAELKRQGFDLSTAAQDWTATQKHLATLNGAQQERLRQAVSFTSDSLGIIDDLYNQWQKVGPTSGWKVFNKASLATSKQLPGEAGNLAHRLDAQISDLTSELGTVYKGGNSSTDESLKLAAKNLEADWNEKTFKDAINQVRQNLEIRKNSIRHSQPAGVSENSPYTPKTESETPKDYGDAAGKPENSTGKLPDGTPVIVKGGRIVAQKKP